MSFLEIWRKYNSSIGVIIGLWCLTILAVWPLGEFPINDDWAFTKSALRLSDGKWFYTDWQGMPLITQTIWGALWIKIFGFSFLALRLSMVVMALIGIVFLYKSLFLFMGKAKAAFTTSLFAFNPVFIHLSVSYMSDVFTLSLLLIATYHYLIAKKMSGRRQLERVMFACGLVLLAALNRQTALILPVAFLVEGLMNRGTKVNTKQIRWIVGGTILTGVLMILVHDLLVASSNYGLPHNYGFQMNMILEGWFIPREELLYMMNYLLGAAVMTGLLTMPLTYRSFRSWKATELLMLGLMFVASVFRDLTLGTVWPISGDVVHPNGLGPWLFPGFNSNEIHVIGKLEILVALFALLGMASFIKIVGLVNRRSFGWWFFLLSLLPLSVSYLSDRYILIAIPFLIMAFDGKGRPFLKNVLPHQKVILALLIVVSVIVNRDYFVLRRNHWEVTNEMVQEYGLESVNAGFEFNAWHRFSMDNYNGDFPENSWPGKDVIRVSPATFMRGYVLIESHPIKGSVTLYPRNINVFELRSEPRY